MCFSATLHGSCIFPPLASVCVHKEYYFFLSWFQKWYQMGHMLKWNLEETSFVSKCYLLLLLVIYYCKWMVQYEFWFEVGISSLLQQNGSHLNLPFSLYTLVKKSSLGGIWAICKEAAHTHIPLSLYSFGINTNPLSWLDQIGVRPSGFLHWPLALCCYSTNKQLDEWIDLWNT